MAQIPITKVAITLEEFLRQQTPNTARAYAADIRVYAAWRKAETPVHALQKMLSGAIVTARKIVRGIPSQAIDQICPGHSVRHQISTLRLFVATARMDGMVVWALELRKVCKGTSETLIATVKLEIGPYPIRDQESP